MTVQTKYTATTFQDGSERLLHEMATGWHSARTGVACQNRKLGRTAKGYWKLEDPHAGTLYT